MAHTRHRLHMQRTASLPWLLGSSVERQLQQQEGRRPRAALRCRRMPSRRQVAPGTLDVEADDEELERKEEEWEEAIDKELSEVEELTVHNLWVNPYVPELFQDPQADIQEWSGFPSSMGMDVTGEAAGGLQRTSPVPAVPMDTKLAASTLGVAAEEEEHCPPLTPVSQEEEAAPAPASPVCGEEEAAPQDPQADTQEGTGFPSSKGKDVTGEAAGDLQRASPVPAVPTDTKLAASTLGEAAEEEEHCPPLTPVSQEEEAALTPASLGADEQEAAPQAQSQALGLLSPNAQEGVPQEAAVLITREPPVQGVDQETSQQLSLREKPAQLLPPQQRLRMKWPLP
ncbi:microtubule-actin cross-linking factor 1, isoforms 6/7-like [Pezoporus flaviventris]|uniref:microtubule-actin cross-linking factor 1, isoforms 6/7-like n=1 Tax=Pezoporus flaviventris TaxID=889875 RepID=UPI002AB20E67|nr:microtubule-actin cross-linking factor 1, isoforms 6/7-like [Pezoporus flaviventris]